LPVESLSPASRVTVAGVVTVSVIFAATHSLSVA
jgi:hypothetical protein